MPTCFAISRIIVFFVWTWLISGVFLMFLARHAYSRVPMVSSILPEEGETVAMISVLVLPPRDS